MKINNIRYWFACNSSSTHSVVCHPESSKVKDALGDYFGWDNFVAASGPAKKLYLKTRIHGRLRGGMTADMVADALFPTTGAVTGIDHQSIPLIPRKYGTQEPSYEFFQDMVDYVLRDDVVIYGGNDNDDGVVSPPFPNVKWYDIIPKDSPDDDWTCRKDGDWWVIFNVKNGTKVELSFKDNPEPRIFSDVPELVDIKITDCCPHGCVYCYQGSTANGPHADDPYSWLYNLHKIGTFEVAIGGGEPTSHPKFKELIDWNLKDLRINFSTRNIDWVCNNADLIREKCGGFAISTDSDWSSITQIAEMMEKRDLLEKMSFQYVMETADDYRFMSLLRFCHDKGIRLTLLGYKETGRGAAAKKKLPHTKIQSGEDWITCVKEANCHVGIDTALAIKVPKNVFDERHIRRTEGTHSMYIDAVNNLAGISSYTEKLMQIERNNIVDVFKRLQNDNIR